MGGKKIRVKRAFRRFGRDKEGVAAVEFALVALPFLLFLIGMAEVAMMGFAQTSLDFAVGEVGRRIRTGQVQTEGLTVDQVRNELCQNISGLIGTNCANTLHLDVDSYQSFVGVNTDTPLQNGAFNQAQLNFNPGAPSQVVLVRAYFEWQMITPFFSQFFGNMIGGKRLISSTMLFRNEPYPTPLPPPAPRP